MGHRISQFKLYVRHYFYIFQHFLLVVYTQTPEYNFLLLMMSMKLKKKKKKNQGPCRFEIEHNRRFMLKTRKSLVPHLKIFVLFCFFVFLGLHLQHKEGPRLVVKLELWLVVKLELQLPVYATATATPDLSCIWDLHCSSWQCWILNPLRKARDRTHILMVTGRVLYC